MFTPAIFAAFHGHREVLDLLLDAGADPNARSTQDNTALHLAAMHGFEDCVRSLLEHGADPYVKNKVSSNKFAHVTHRQLLTVCLCCSMDRQR